MQEELSTVQPQVTVDRKMPFDITNHACGDYPVLRRIHAALRYLRDFAIAFIGLFGIATMSPAMVGNVVSDQYSPRSADGVRFSDSWACQFSAVWVLRHRVTQASTHTDRMDTRHRRGLQCRNAGFSIVCPLAARLAGLKLALEFVRV